MKKLFYNIISFSLFSLVLYFLYIIFFSTIFGLNKLKNINYLYGGYGYQNKRVEDLENYNDIDILFLGSSLSYRSFDTDILKNNGYTSFNLGSSAQTHIQTNLLLKQYLGKLNPKLVVYEISPLIFKNEGKEASLNIISNGKVDFPTSLMVLKSMDINIFNTFLYRFYCYYFRNEKNTIKNEINDDTYVKGGFIKKKLQYYTNKVLPPEDIFLNKAQKKYFKKNIKLLKDKNIKVILVKSPITTAKNNGLKNMTEFDTFISKFNLKYYNFNKPVFLVDTLHFYDEVHLNQKGVIIFNNKIIELVKKSI